MPDNQNNRSPGKARKGNKMLSGSLDHELEYLSNKWRVTRDMVNEAIEKCGYDRAKIEEYLSKHDKD